MVTSSWEALPSEILLAIFRNIQSLDRLRQCLLVCKAWQKCVEVLIFKTVVLSKHNVTAFINGIQESPNHVGEDVKILYLCNKDGSVTCDSLEPNFSCLVGLCPNVQVVTCNKMTRLLFSKLAGEVEKDNWRSLVRIPAPADSLVEDLEVYDKAALACGQLELIELYPFDTLGANDPLSANAVKSKKLIGSVKNFSCLKDLVLNLRVYVNLYVVLESMMMLEDCPTIESLTTPWPHFEERDVPDLRNFDSKLSATQSWTNAKKFNGSIKMSDQSMSYFMYKFPNLQHLVLNEDEDYPFFFTFSTLSNLSKSVQNRFFKYIARMELHDLNFRLTDVNDEIAADMICRYLRVSKFIRESSNNNNISSRNMAKISYIEDDTRLYGDTFKITNGYSNKDNLKIYNLFLLHEKLVEEVAKNVEELHFYGYLSQYHEWDPPRYDIELRPTFEWYVGNNIQDFIKNCFLLKKLNVSHLELSADYNKNDTLETLILDHCYTLNSQVLAELSASFSGLKHLYLVGFSCLPEDQDRPLRYTVVDMRHSSLETITWEDGLWSCSDEKLYGLPVINLKVATSSGDKYYLLDDHGISKTDKAQYKRFKKSTLTPPGNRPDRTIHIKCESLRSFKRKFNTKDV